MNKFDEFKEIQDKLIKFLEENKLSYISTTKNWTEINIYKTYGDKIIIENKPVNRY